ncbi:MAG TPA: hypothetical protein DCE55_22985 [Planctomycetaceae bacterium]|nr:hypothetical protein [Planctomycetaceae bacterium]
MQGDACCDEVRIQSVSCGGILPGDLAGVAGLRERNTSGVSRPRTANGSLACVVQTEGCGDSATSLCSLSWSTTG